VKRGDIWLVSMDPTAGHEQQGTRTVLIVSPDEFNRVIGVPVVVPVTSGGAFARTRGFAVPLQGAGTTTVGIIRCDQLRSVDLTARKGRFLEAVPQAVINEVLMKLAPIFA
jgi:mRNA interferase ChpB